MINFAENIESLEEIIISYLLGVDDDGIIRDEEGIEVDRGKLINVMKPDFFTVPFYSNAFKYIKEFYNNYEKTPNFDELVKVFELKNEQIEEDKMLSIKDVRVSVYTNEFLYKYIKSFLMVKVLNSQINKVAIKLKTEKPDPDNIAKVIDYVRSELSDKIDVEITNSGNGLDIYNCEDHIQHGRDTKSTGDEYLDTVLGGGYEPKTFIVFQGRAKIGKSMVMSNLAARAALLGNNVGIYTVELGADKYIKRIGSNLFNVPQYDYKNFNSKENLGVLKDAVRKFKEEHPGAGEINIREAPTGAATVLDIENHFIRVERKMSKKFDVIFVDYLNLLKSSADSNANMYSSIKKICEDLRKIAQRNMWCIVSATQIKTSAFSSDDLGLDSTAESSGLIATVDTLFGLMGQPGSPYVKMKCIANRDGGYMNSYANYVKDMNFFRLNEDSTDYMNLGEEAIITAENYQKFREAPSQTYNDFQYRVMQNAAKQEEPKEVEYHHMEQQNLENMSMEAGIDNIQQQTVQAPVDELPMGEAPYSYPEPVPQEQIAAQQPVAQQSRFTFTMQQAQPQYAQPTVAQAQPQQAQPNVVQAQPQHTQQPVAQQVQVQPQNTAGYTPTPVSAPSFFKQQAQPQYAQPTVAQAQPQQIVQQPVYQQAATPPTQYNHQPVQQAQYQPQAQPVAPPPQNNVGDVCNDTSTLVVNNLSEAEKIAILTNENGVQSIVPGL